MPRELTFKRATDPSALIYEVTNGLKPLITEFVIVMYLFIDKLGIMFPISCLDDRPSDFRSLTTV
jgi:hypothetical protein